MYDTEEYVLERIHEYSGGLDRLVQLCPETPKETQKRSDQIGDYVDTHKSRNEHKEHKEKLEEHHYMAEFVAARQAGKKSNICVLS
jgi:hypothetical protein